jgi:mono/diheme cytochrome c family protein
MTPMPPSTPRAGRRRAVIAGLVLVAALALVFAGLRIWSGVKPAGPAGPVRTPPSPQEQLAAGKQLFGNYCAGCHGEKGDGNGPAARFLYPRPRDFTEAKFRLASTDNHAPTDDDLFGVVTRGMPGSAMFPFAHLGEDDRRALVAHVRQLTRDGLTDRSLQEAQKAGAEIDLDELHELVGKLTTPGPAIEVPDLPDAGPESIARGQEHYLRLCKDCHGTTGQGDGVKDQRDDNGMPTRPRDFTRGIFKSGRDPHRLYARIMLGMPGTPMPSSAMNLQPDGVGDLINFVLSLSDPSAQAKLEHRRTRLLARRYADTLPDEIPEEAWQDALAVYVVVSPLWWRNYAEPDLHVQALHDGQTLALRLSWQDETRNDAAVRPQDFEDMAAVQLFKGSPEPFLGMGALDRAVDVWLWRAGAQAGGRYADVDTTYPNMAVDLYPFEKSGGGARPHAPQLQPPEFLAARAAGNQRADPDEAAQASSHQARGFGSLTMRPRISQLVKASGHWQDGRWTVVLRRPLQVEAEAGLPLAPGDRLSAAFALWDGAAGDRNGQKLVTIWHDLELE